LIIVPATFFIHRFSLFFLGTSQIEKLKSLFFATRF